MLGNNNQALDMLYEMQNMTNEQQAQKVADLCNQKGISKEQLKQFFGYK